MKNLLYILMLCLFYVCVNAQTKDDYRVWDGHVYNVTKASMWTTIPPDIYVPSGTYIEGYSYKEIKIYTGKIVNIGTTNLLVRITVERAGSIPDDDEWYDKLILVKNHPKVGSFVDGDVFPRDRFLYLGNERMTNRLGKVFVVKSYTYGFPYRKLNK